MQALLSPGCQKNIETGSVRGKYPWTKLRAPWLPGPHFFFSFFDPTVCGILVPWPGIKPMPPAVEQVVHFQQSPFARPSVVNLKGSSKGHAMVGGVGDRVKIQILTVVWDRPEGLHFSSAPGDVSPRTTLGVAGHEVWLREAVDGGKKQKPPHSAQESQPRREHMMPTPA